MKVVVIGAGASGLMLAGRLAGRAECLVLEAGERVGKKLYITGKGRCNLTNDCDVPSFLNNVVGGAKFLQSALRGFAPEDTAALLESLGVPLKTERGGRVFPRSDKANDVVTALEKYARRGGTAFRLNTRVAALLTEEGRVTGVRTAQGETIACDCVVVATGGISYPATGSTGDGYRFAKEVGHSVVPPLPALAGMRAAGTEALAGLTLKNVAATLLRGDRTLRREFGELLFTHTGMSGPIILTLSSYMSADKRRGGNGYAVAIDLKPALDAAALDARLVRELSANAKKSLRNVLTELTPKKLIPVLLAAGRLDGDKPAHAVSRAERERLGAVLKELRYNVSVEAIESAIVTAGGVDVREVSPKTMESKFVSGLYFTGEVLDTDALTGGFNLQIAFSTAAAAAEALAARTAEKR